MAISIKIWIQFDQRDPKLEWDAVNFLRDEMGFTLLKQSSIASKEKRQFLLGVDFIEFLHRWKIRKETNHE